MDIPNYLHDRLQSRGSYHLKKDIHKVGRRNWLRCRLPAGQQLMPFIRPGTVYGLIGRRHIDHVVPVIHSDRIVVDELVCYILIFHLFQPIVLLESAPSRQPLNTPLYVLLE